MERSKRTLGLVVLLALVGLANTGCIKKMILNGTIQSTRKAAAAINTISDYEVANTIAFAAIAQAEGYHYLAPDNEDALFLLTKGWAGIGFGFIEDKMEQAEDEFGDMSELYEYHKARAVAAYARAIYYGTKLLDLRNPGFAKAKKNAKTMRAWLAGFTDPEGDTPCLMWTAQAWLSKTNLMKDHPEVVAELFIGAEILKRAVDLDETYMYGTGRVILGAYHARSTMAELDLAKQNFERALQINGGKALLAKFNFATKYYCAKVDKANYVRLLNEVIEAGDVLPEQRLQNTIAKRRARRYLSRARMEACGFKVEGDGDGEDEDEGDDVWGADG